MGVANRSVRSVARWLLLSPLAAAVGCATPTAGGAGAWQPPAAPVAYYGPGGGGVRQASYQTPATQDPKKSAGDPLPPPRPADPKPQAPPGVQPRPDPAAPPFAGATELSVEALVEQVVARNPSLPQMVAAYEAAAARAPQVSSLDDPLFGTTFAPGTLGSRMDGYRFEVFQRYPFPGKRQLRGEVARAEASAAGRDVEDVRQQLVESARDAFYEYYLVARSGEINEEVLQFLRSARKTAEGLFATGKVKQQDILDLDVEIGRQRSRTVLVDRQRRVAAARINALLHLPPDADLPPPPKAIRAEDDQLPDPAALRTQALTQRLDLLALADRLRAAEASLELARREYYPDFDVMAAYDAFWEPNVGQRAQVAVRINLPVRLARRQAAVAEAQSRLTELRAQVARQQDVAGFEVQQAYEQWRESLLTLRLFEKEVLPAARLSVKSAQAGYQTGDIQLGILLAAERNRADLQEQYYQATAEFFRRRTVLQRALTGTPAATPIPVPAQRPSPGQPGSPTGLGRQ